MLKRVTARSLAAGAGAAALTSVVVSAATPFAAQRPDLEKAEFFVVVDRESYAGGSEVRMAAAVTVERGWHVNSNTPTYEYLIPTELTILMPPGWPEPRVDYPAGHLETFAFAAEPISVYDGQFLIEARAAVPVDVSPGTVRLEAELRYQACDDRSCLPPTTATSTVAVMVGRDGAPTNAEYFEDLRTLLNRGRADAEQIVARSLAGFLLLGLIGGLLLNAMPCVLPVLSLKLLGLVKSRAQGRAHVVTGSLATAAGILVSFWALAAAAIGARLAGATVGWGIQFQEPTFVTFLTLVVVLFCLNLWGVFEVPLPARLAGWAADAGSEGLPGHFTAGLFATLLATPCSAPFLGTAVGFALSQPAAMTLAVFTAVGLGMALPYLALAIAPGVVRILPRPGPWMDQFRTVMGFCLAAAAVWLLYVLSSQISRERLAFIELAVLTLALFLWLRRSSPPRSARGRLALIGLFASLAAALLLAASADRIATEAPSQATESLIRWRVFDRQEAESLAQEGRLVFVDVTADWCFTCKVNERLVLETREVADAFALYGVVAMKADWTNRDPEIATFLTDHGKYGIPFYLLYRPGRPPHLFSELLTKDAVVSTVAEAATPGRS